MTKFQFPQNRPSPYLKLQIGLLDSNEKPLGKELPIEALVDTGFDGFLAVPASFFDQPPHIQEKVRVSLADGSETVLDICRLKISFPGYPQLKFIAETYLTPDNLCLLGLEFIHAVCQEFQTEMVLDLLGQNLRFDSVS
jgi:predicted aspartyl protease